MKRYITGRFLRLPAVFAGREHASRVAPGLPSLGIRSFLLLALAVAGPWCVAATTGSPTTSTVASASTEAPAGQADLLAQAYMGKCAGCHTIGGGPLSGPDLLASTKWTDANLIAAIKRMEKNTGPIPDDEARGLAGFIKDPTVRNRLAAEEQRAAAKAMANMEPPNAALGEKLFHGIRSLENGAPACSACHAVSGMGGNLGPSLQASFKKLGEMPLRSSIEKSSYKVMKPIYEKKPVTPEEAAHLAAYLATLPPEGPTTANGFPVGLVGTAGAVVLLGGMTLMGRKRRISTRARLIVEANRR